MTPYPKSIHWLPYSHLILDNNSDHFRKSILYQHDFHFL